jgi:hypothetical protein
MHPTVDGFKLFDRCDVWHDRTQSSLLRIAKTIFRETSAGRRTIGYAGVANPFFSEALPREHVVFSIAQNSAGSTAQLFS